MEMYPVFGSRTEYFSVMVAANSHHEAVNKIKMKFVAGINIHNLQCEDTYAVHHEELEFENPSEDGE